MLLGVGSLDDGIDGRRVSDGRNCIKLELGLPEGAPTEMRLGATDEFELGFFDGDTVLGELFDELVGLLDGISVIIVAAIGTLVVIIPILEGASIRSRFDGLTGRGSIILLLEGVSIRSRFDGLTGRRSIIPLLEGASTRSRFDGLAGKGPISVGLGGRGWVSCSVGLAVAISVMKLLEPEIPEIVSSSFPLGRNAPKGTAIMTSTTTVATVHKIILETLFFFLRLPSSLSMTPLVVAVDDAVCF